MIKNYKRIISTLLFFTMIFANVTNTVFAVTNSNPVAKYITKISLVDDKGNEITTNDTNRIDQGVDVSLRFDFNFPKGVDSTKLLNDGYIITLPDTLGIKQFSVDLTYKNIICGKAEKSGNQILFTFNEAFATESTKEDIVGYFICDAKFTPADNSGRCNLEFKSDDTPVYNLDVFYKINRIEPQITKAKEEVTFSDGSKGYKWTTTIVPGNTRTGDIKLVDALQNLKLIENDSNYPITFDGLEDLNELSYDYQENADGENLVSSMSYTIHNFEKLIEDKEYKFIYYTKVNPELYLKADKSTVSSQSALYSSNGIGDDIQSTKVAESEKEEDTITPDIIHKVGVMSADKNSIDWTVTINGNGISMYGAKFYIKKGEFLKLTESSVNMTEENQRCEIVKSQLDGYDYGIGIGDFSKTKIIKFTTDISEDFYENNHSGYNFDVDVTLDWNNKNDGSTGFSTKGRWQDDLQQPIGNSAVVKKDFDNYDPSTGIITWKVTVNSNKKSLKKVKVTDTMDGDQTLDGVYDTDKTTKLSDPTVTDKSFTIDIGNLDKGNLDNEKILYIKTQLPEKVYHSNTCMEYKNNVSATATSGIDGTVTTVCSQKINNNVVKKSGVYDEATHMITWSITVNSNKTDLKDVKLTDDLSPQIEYVPNSFTIDNGAQVDKMQYVPSADTKKSGTITYDFGDIDKQEYKIVYKTKVNDPTMFYKNDTPSVSNTAHLDYDDGQKAEYSASVEVPVSVISKEVLDNEDKPLEDKDNDGRPKNINVNQSTIRWQITVNEDHMLIENGVIKDKFLVKDKNENEIKPMDLDASDMRLMRYDLVNDSEAEPVEVPITKDMLTYDNIDKQFSLNIPKVDNDKAKYVVTYTLKTTDTSIRKFDVTNNAEFSCTNDNRTAQNDGKTIHVAFAAGAFGGNHYNKKITVTKTDKSDSSKYLKNAVFALYDKFGNKIAEKVTDETGKAAFEGLTENSDYVVKEIKAPEGYNINSEEYPVTTSEDKEVKVTDEKKTAAIKFTKYSESETGDKLKGAEFALYDGEDNNCGTAVSDDNGLVEFDGVKYGNYTIKETAAPKNYELSNEMINVTMSEDDTGNVIVNLSKDYMINYHKHGTMTVLKVDADDKEKLLKGAEFELKDNKGVVVNTGTTDENGKIVWETVAYGTYSLKETKAPEGYVLNSSSKTCEFTGDTEYKITNNKIQQGSGGSSGSGSQPSEPDSTSVGSIKIHITDKKDTNVSLAGAEFSLIDSNGQVVGTAIADNDGNVTWSNIPYGDYKVTETKAPEGYVINNINQSVTLSDNNTNSELTLSDSKIYAAIEFYKVSSKDHLIRIRGAFFAIFRSSDINFINPLKTAVSDENGLVKFEEMPVGSYVIKEIKAAEGYKISDELITANVTNEIKDLNDTIKPAAYEIESEPEEDTQKPDNDKVDNQKPDDPEQNGNKPDDDKQENQKPADDKQDNEKPSDKKHDDKVPPVNNSNENNQNQEQSGSNNGNNGSHENTSDNNSDINNGDVSINDNKNNSASINANNNSGKNDTNSDNKYYGSKDQNTSKDSGLQSGKSSNNKQNISAMPKTGSLIGINELLYIALLLTLAGTLLLAKRHKSLENIQ